MRVTELRLNGNEDESDYDAVLKWLPMMMVFDDDDDDDEDDDDHDDDIDAV